MRVFLAAFVTFLSVFLGADIYVPAQLHTTNLVSFSPLASVTAATAVCQVNGCTATGASYGNAQTGVITLTTNSGAFVCSTYPKLNVTTNAGGNITTVNSVATAGSCTVMGGTGDEVWTTASPLSAGTGALFSLTWTATAQTYTPTANIQYALVYSLGGGGQGGGGASTVSTTASSGGARGRRRESDAVLRFRFGVGNVENSDDRSRRAECGNPGGDDYGRGRDWASGRGHDFWRHLQGLGRRRRLRRP